MDSQAKSSQVVARPDNFSNRRTVFGVLVGALGFGLATPGQFAFAEPMSSPKRPITAMTRQGRMIQSGPDIDRLNRIASKVSASLTPTNTSQWSSFMTGGPGFKASATPQHQLLMSKPLLDLCENDGQVAALVCHRLARLEASNGAGPVNDALIREATQDLRSPRSAREVEVMTMSADITAVRTLAKLGYDPRDGLVIWERIGVANDQGFTNYPTRLARMRGELRRMGYQI